MGATTWAHLSMRCSPNAGSVAGTFVVERHYGLQNTAINEG